VTSGVLSSLLAVGFSPAVLVQFAVLTALGGTAGGWIGRRITATELPQTVAALHSVVGLAAVLTSIGSVLAETGHISTLHLVTAYLGVLIGEDSNGFSRANIENSDNSPRWYNIYRLDRRIPQISGTNVVQASRSTRTTSYQHRPTWS
jgi:hypothetical protein